MACALCSCATSNPVVVKKTQILAVESWKVVMCECGNELKISETLYVDVKINLWCDIAMLLKDKYGLPVYTDRGDGLIEICPTRAMRRNIDEINIRAVCVYMRDKKGRLVGRLDINNGQGAFTVKDTHGFAEYCAKEIKGMMEI